MDARIYQRPKNAMQSGRARTQLWVLEYEPCARKKLDPLTGWSGSNDTRQQVQLEFETQEEAQAYAARHGLKVTLVPTAPRRIKLQSYADNFR